MHMLRHRPLFACCAAFLLAAVAGLALPTAGKWIIGVLLLLAGGGFAALGLRRRLSAGKASRGAAGVGTRFAAVRGLSSGKSAAAAVACLAACLALLQSHLTFHSPDRVRLEAAEQTAVRVEGTVTDRRGSGGYLTSYTLSLSSLDGEPVGGTALLTCHYVSDLQPGHRVELEATVIPLSEAAGDGYSATALLGDGYTVGLISESEETVTVLEENAGRLTVRTGSLRRFLAARLELAAGRDGEGLPSALLLGDKTALSDHVTRDFARAGVSHMLAVSGLHVTLLFGLLAGFLRLLRAPKGVSAAVAAVCGAGYLFLLGFPPSATRAVIMLGAVYLSSLLRTRADPLTSLGVAGAVILTVSPCTVADAGFWMSFLATLGLVTVIPLLHRDGRASRTANAPSGSWRRWWRGLHRLLTALGVGLVAMSFTLFLVAAVIGELGVLSPLSTLLMTPLCTLSLVLSLLCLLLLPVGAGWLVGMLNGRICALMAAMAEGLGNPSFAVISLRHPAVLPLAVVMVAVTLGLLAVDMPRRRQKLILLPMLAGWVLIGGILGADGLLTRDRVELTYLQPSTQSDALVMVAGQRGFVCDLSNGSLSSMTASAREAERQGATELAAFMVTHYHSRTPGALWGLLNRETVRALWLPRPKGEEEYGLLLACVEKADLADVPVYLYETGEALGIFGDGTVTLETASLSRSVQPILLVSVILPVDGGREERLLYCGSAVFESGLADTAAKRVAEADTVIFGSHGPLFKAPFGAGLDLSEAKTVLLSRNGDTAAWFDPSAVPDSAELWLGPWRASLPRP